jgi:C-terminal processing protease CtpA/Prc
MILMPVLAMAAVPVTQATAQIPRGMTPLAPSAPSVVFASAAPHAVVGISTVSGSSSRDTLGVLVSMIHPDSPAEKSGLQEGDRIASVNGVNLRLAHSDVGDEEMAGALNNRLQRAMSHVKPGDVVQLRVYSAGEWKTVTIKAEAPPSARVTTSRSSAPRASLGVSLASMGNDRDSLGVMILAITDSGPAAKAGLQEGNRIQAINGVDLRRVHSNDDDDDDEGSFSMAGAPARKLQRELAKLKPGDVAKLRVYADGGVRTVDVKTVDAKDLPDQSRAIVIRRSGPRTSFDVQVPPMPDMSGMEVPMPRVDMERDGNIVLNLRRTLDGIRATAGPMLERMGTTMQTLGFSLERRRLDW